MNRIVFAVAALWWTCGLWSAPGALGQVPAIAIHFQDQPADSLARLMEPGLGIGLDLPGVPAEQLARRLAVSVPSAEEVVTSDPVTGLVLTQKRRWLPHERMLLLETTLRNAGQAPAAVASVRLADWVFRVSEGQDSLRYRELAHRQDTWYGSTYWTGPDWTRVGKDWHHPGENTPSVRRFTAPRDGRVTITGRVYKAHVEKSSDGVRLFIRHGARDVWTAEIGGDDAKGVEPNLSLDLRKGEAIRFIVHKRGLIFCDTTHWDPVIRYADGETFQASQGFAGNKQPEAAWSYEMEVDPQTKMGLPVVHGFCAEGALFQTSLSLAQPVEFGDQSALGLWVVTDGADRSGLAVAVLGGRPWRFRAGLTAEGRLSLRLFASDEKVAVPLGPGQTLSLPPVAAGAYRGPWSRGMSLLQGLLASGAVEGAAGLRDSIHKGNDPVRELDYWAMVQADWRRSDKIAETPQSYAAATRKHLEKARFLSADLRRGQPADFLGAESRQLEQLAQLAQGSGLGLAECRGLYLRVRSLKRRIALANPLMGFGKLVFTKRVPTSYSHLVMQYFGWRARPGGGLFVLEEPGRSLAGRDILGGKLAGGNVLEPRLSFDARRIVFSFVKAGGRDFDPAQLNNQIDEAFYHVYEVHIDGTGLRQLTNGPYDDLMPTYLPDGGIVFSSTRRRGYARCFGGQFSPRWHVYTLHRMDGDGKNIRTLSFHDTNEWFPTVLPTGQILYGRWDYIDRDAVTHQNLWTTRPDGTSPAALWGNATASPHCSFQPQPIPGSNKIVFTASAHHSIAAGSIAIVDPAVARDGHQAITRITPEIPFPEAEGMNIPEYYEAPWPLSEKYFLVAYSPTPLVWEPGANEANALGIYLLDAFGNRELIYRDPEIGSTNPCPLVPRPTPPVLPSHLPENAPPQGEMLLIDVYRGLGSVPRGSIKALRIVQIFPKTTHVANSPPIGMAAEENGRAILGTVPVEPDGSARFVVPAGRPILFQALDADGFAYQTMRTVTYVQPGEKVSCVGCHEDRMSAPIRDAAAVVAMRRAPSPIDPGPLGGRPFSFVEVVQPVLDRHCTRCHGGEKTEGKIDLTAKPEGAFTRSYVALCGDRNFWAEGTNPKNAAEALVPRFGARNQVQRTPPGGMYGALGSRLIGLLRQGHYEAKLAPDEFRRLAAWIDLNAIFYGVNDPACQARQLRGEAVGMPEIQ